MKIFLLLFFFTISRLTYSQKNDYLIENATYFYLGMENRYYLEDSFLQNPFIKSSEAEVLKKGKYFIITLKLPNRDSIHLDVYDIRENDTIKIKTLSIPEKRLPDPRFSIDGKLIVDSISKSALLKAGKFNIMFGDQYLDKYLNFFELKSFDLEIQGKHFHSNSNNLTPSMLYWIKDNKSLTLRIRNDNVILKTGDQHPRVIYGDKTFYLIK